MLLTYQYDVSIFIYFLFYNFITLSVSWFLIHFKSESFEYLCCFIQELCSSTTEFPPLAYIQIELHASQVISLCIRIKEFDYLNFQRPQRAHCLKERTLIYIQVKTNSYLKQSTKLNYYEYTYNYLQLPLIIQYYTKSNLQKSKSNLRRGKQLSSINSRILTRASFRLNPKTLETQVHFQS